MDRGAGRCVGRRGTGACAQPTGHGVFAKLAAILRVGAVAIAATQLCAVPHAAAAPLQPVAVASVAPPTLDGAVSRKVHGSAGTFDLPLSSLPANPTVEPRQGASAPIVFTFDKPVTAAIRVGDGGAGGRLARRPSRGNDEAVCR